MRIAPHKRQGPLFFAASVAHSGRMVWPFVSASIPSPISTAFDIEQLHLSEIGRKHCDCTFVDVGLNSGASLTAWPVTMLSLKRQRNEVIPARLPWCVHQLQKAVTLGEGGGSVCLYGFEPDPRWAPSLQKMEKQMKGKGLGVRIYTKTALATTTGNMTLYIAPHSTHSSLVGNKKALPGALKRGEFGQPKSKRAPEPGETLANSNDVVRAAVSTFSAADFVHALARRKHAASSSLIAMKIDIEGCTAAEPRTVPFACVMTSVRRILPGSRIQPVTRLAREQRRCRRRFVQARRAGTRVARSPRGCVARSAHQRVGGLRVAAERSRLRALRQQMVLRAAALVVSFFSDQRKGWACARILHRAHAS